MQIAVMPRSTARQNPSVPDPPKIVAANQKAVDALPLDSGTWRVEGLPGLYLRCRRASRSFFIQRRVRGRLVKRTLGELSVKAAKAEAMRTWSGMKPKPAAAEVVTFEAALNDYLQDKELAPKTLANYRYNSDRYLGEWLKRDLREVGEDRAGVRRLQREITKGFGAATSNQVLRLISAVYRWARKQDTSLPEAPTTATVVARIPARDWALSPDELKAWWCSSSENKNGKLVHRGVRTLGPIKKMWWLCALFTGARAGSIEALQWTDIDFDKKVIRFAVTKGDRPYAIPMADKLAELFVAYRDSGAVPPCEWVFPSPKAGYHLARVKNDREGVAPPHRMRHSFRTTLAELAVSSDQSRLLMGHSMGGDVSRGYISSPLVLESLRPIANAVAQHYAAIIGL